MNRFLMVCGVLITAVVLTGSFAPAQGKKETVNEKITRMEKEGLITIKVGESTTDACSKVNDVYVLSTTDGKITLKPGDTVYFQRTTKDEYERTGGWYWNCGDSPEKARIKILNGYIKAIRSGNTGKIDWYHCVIELK